MDNCTADYLLDKKIKIYQPVDGYRASSDAVILSAMISLVNKTDKILDIGSGTGAVSLCVAARFPANKIIGLEIQEQLVELSNLSAKDNGFENLEFINADIRKRVAGLESSFDHVITNPPYTDHDMPSPNKSKATAHNHHEFDLSQWLGFAVKMLKPKGYLYTINRAEAVGEILSAISSRMGEIVIVPLYSKPGQPAKRVLIKAKKASRAKTKILPGIIIHDDAGNYTPDAEQILRQGDTIW